MSTHHFTVSDIATHNVETIESKRDIEESIKWLNEKGFDVAPVENGTGDIVGYVKRNNLLNIRDKNQIISDIVKDITISEMVSSNSKFSTIVSSLDESSFYFIGGKSSLDGIITKADLNTSEVRSYLFSQIMVIEQKLKNYVRKYIPNWEEHVDSDNLNKIEGHYKSNKKMNIELPKINHASLGTIVHIIDKDDKCMNLFGCRISKMYDIKDLRNDIAHVKPIIKNTKSGEYDDNRRTIKDLYDIYTEMRRLDEKL